MTLVLALAVGLGAIGAWRLATPHPVNRLVAFALPGILVVLVGLSIAEIMGAALIEWNDVRLAPSAGLLHGVALYYPPGEGALLGHIYGPISALYYLPAAVLPTPTMALAAGVLMALLIYAVPIVAMLRTEARGDTWLLVGSGAFFALFTLYSRILYTPAFRIHADAPALGLSALACALIYSPARRARTSLLAASALAAVLAVGSKQVMLAIVPALLLYVGLTDGRKALRHYTLVFAAVGTATLVLIWLWLDFEAMILNAILIPRGQPWKSPDKLRVLEAAFRDLAPRAAPFALVILALPLLDWLRDRSIVSRPRVWLRDNAWSLPVLVGLLSIPTSLLGRSVFGGSMNALAFSLYFLVAGALLGLVRLARSDAKRDRTAVVASLAIIGALLAAVLAPGLSRLPLSPAGWRDNPERQAYHFMQQHPGQVFVPFKPLISLLAEGRGYHFSYGIRDREMGGVPVDDRHLRAHLPTDLRYVLIHRKFEVYMMQYLPEFDTQIEASELPGWQILTRAESPN